MIAFATTEQERWRLARNFETIGEHLDHIEVKEVFCPEQVGVEDTLLIRSKDPRVIRLFSSACAKNIICESLGTIAFDDNKQLLKDILYEHGIVTPKTVRISEIKKGERYFVKPLSLGDSIGVDENSLCSSKEEVLRKVEDIRRSLGTQTLVEEYIDGDEYTVSVANLKGGGKLSAVTKIGSDTGFLSFDVKDRDLEKKTAIKDYELQKRLEYIAQSVCHIIGVKNFARVDIRMRGDTPVVLEVNVVPGLDKRGYLCSSLCQKYGFGYDELLKKLFMLNE